MAGFARAMAVEERGLAREENVAGLPDPFAGLVRRQSRFVFQVAYSVLRNSHDAEDVVQDVFLKLFKTGQWQGILNERAFLARAAWRMAIDRRPERSNSDKAVQDVPTGGADPERAAITADWSATVQR